MRQAGPSSLYSYHSEHRVDCQELYGVQAEALGCVLARQPELFPDKEEAEFANLALARSVASSATKGQIVPTNTTTVAVASKRLFTTKLLSRLTMLKTELDVILGARTANKVKLPPMATTNIPRIKTPRSGSFANA